MEVITSLSQLYTSVKDLKKEKKISAEMNMLIDEYAAASEPNREHSSVGQDDRSSVASDILTIDLAQHLNICDDSGICQKHTAHEVNEQNQIIISETPPFVYKKMPKNLHNGNQGPSVAVRTDDNTYMRNMTAEQPREKGSPLADTEICVYLGNITSRSENAFKAAGNESIMNTNAVVFKPTASCMASSIGQDLWKQLKSVQTPTFSGDKRTYQS